MDFLKKFWPNAFALEKKVVKPFVIQIVIYAVAMIIMGAIAGIVGALVGGIEVVGPIVTILLGLLCAIVEIYCTAGIVFSILKFTGVFKD